MKPSGELEKRSLHAACPVIKGVKYSMPRWIHVGPYAVGGERPVPVRQKIQKPEGPDGCEDREAGCSEWAVMGECEANPGFMVGSRLSPGACLLSCNRCDMLKGGMEKPHRSRKMGVE
jgi:prolyl 4-hydroxylase